MPSPDQLSAWSAVIQAAIAFIAGAIALREYSAHKLARRADLAMHLARALQDDELVAFAANTLDWGAGIVIVPSTWQHVIPGAPKYRSEDVEEALQPKLTEAASSSALCLLYRQSFVRLFDQLERIAIHVESDSELLNELADMAWLVHRLRRPLYVQLDRPAEARTLYINALEAWYPRRVTDLLRALESRFPERVQQ